MNSSAYIKLIGIISFFILAVSIGIFTCLGFNEPNLRLLIQWSAKISATLFSLAFASSSIQYFWDTEFSHKLLGMRPHMGLSFATFHTSHLIFLIILQQAFHPVFELAKTSSLIGGGAAYVFMYLMALTTFPEVKSKLSVKNWKLLHIAGGYWIWFIFFRSYFKNVFDKNEEYFLFSMLALVLILRVTRNIKSHFSKKGKAE
jgi:hypothetical protein